ncbi:MAG: ABC transporter ATP-binding protein [Pseudomonadota bacterium]
MPDLLRVEDLCVGFGLHGSHHDVLKGVNLRVRPGSVVALVGESGSGKSVTSLAVMGLLPNNAAITRGRIRYTNTQTGETAEIAKLDPESAQMRAIRGGEISMIFQEPMNSLSPLHTIGDQVSEALELHERVDRREVRARTEDMLDQVGFPNPSRAFDMYAFELSGGLRQRAMIAMALICNPSLLIADEPTTALDVTIQAQVLGLLKSLQEKRRMGLLLITHDLGVVANLADEVVVIYHGEVMEAGPVDDIFRRPQHPYLKALLKAVPHFDMKPGERLVSLRDADIEPRTVSLPRVDAAPPAKTDCPTRPLLCIRGITKTFTTRNTGLFGFGEQHAITAVDDVSLDIRRGECVGLVGESGCGKTTLSKLVMRALTPDMGEILLADADPHADRAVDLAQQEGRALDEQRKRIQMVFQDPVNSLSPRMTVLNILREPMEIHGHGNRETQTARAIDLMKAVGLDPRFLNRYPHSFSGGQRQRIGIARALALSPDLLICDEPVSALDVSVQAQVLNLLNDLRKEMGLTYLFISHNLAVVDYVADRIAVMAQGRIVELAPRAALFANPVHPYTRSLLAAVPYPDLDRPLDLERFADGEVGSPSDWPEAFRAAPVNGHALPHGHNLEPITVGDGHIVLARPQADARELVA